MTQRNAALSKRKCQEAETTRTEERRKQNEVFVNRFASLSGAQVDCEPFWQFPLKYECEKTLKKN